MDAGRKILNEILNTDYRDLAERIEENPQSINIIGTCGESPAHISIYKNDLRMLQMLLSAGAEPNFPNLNGDTLVHVAARLGSIDMIKLLYETGKCNLELLNNDSMTALQICNAKLKVSDFHVTKLFRHYDSKIPHHTDNMATMVRLRKECSVYLSHKMAFDGIGKVENLLDDTISHINKRNKVMNIVRGTNGTNTTRFMSRIEYPAYERNHASDCKSESKESHGASHNISSYKSDYKNINQEAHHTNNPTSSNNNSGSSNSTDIADSNSTPKRVFTYEDKLFIDNYSVGIEYIVRSVMACDFVNKSVKIGYSNVLTRMNHRK